MNDRRASDHEPLERAKQIARKTLDGEYDLLLACRDLANLRALLPGLPEDVLDTVVAVASEVDGLPIGSERKYWAADVLEAKDVQAEDYRKRVKDVVTDALQRLVAFS